MTAARYQLGAQGVLTVYSHEGGRHVERRGAERDALLEQLVAHPDALRAERRANMLFHFDVYGTPVPQAGTRSVPTAGGNRQITTGGKDLKPWRQAVAAAAERAYIAAGLTGPLGGPLGLTIEFRFRMPTSRPRRIRDVGRWPHVTTPDADKLLRAVGDSLTASGLIADDKLFADIHVTKNEYVAGWTGADISITRLEATA